MIRTIVFDIGWVFVNLQPRPILDLLGHSDAQPLSLERLIQTTPLDEHESGRLHGRAFLERLAQRAPRPVTLEQVHEKWVDMFELQPAMVDLAHRLSERYRVYLLSNIGDLHWAHLSREYRIHRIGHGALPSFIAGVMKPHAGIYAECERRFGLDPAATVFIDDRPDNIATARSRGWRGIVHSGYAKTVEALRELEVRI
ncbi:MAG TPA: HAD family phosphatase [Steroidobacteraceae bacterium]